MKSLQELEEFFKKDYESNSSSITEFKKALEYYHAEQLPSDVVSITKERGQIPLSENIFKTIVSSYLGYKTQSIQEVKVSGRQQEDKALAFLLNDILKVFSQSELYDREIVKRDLDLILGMGVMEIWITQDKEGDMEIELRNIPPQSFIIDKYSVDKNALDARRFHRLFDMSLEEAKEQFGDKNFESYDDGTYEKRVKVVESWFLESGSWNRYIWAFGNEVYLFEKQPFLNNEHPFIIAKNNIDHKGKWYGIFRNIKPLQDYINFAEIRMGNMLGSFKAFYEEDAVINQEEFVESASLDNSFTPVRSGGLKKINIIENRSDIAVLSQKVNEKRQLMKLISGINDEILGGGGNRQSAAAFMQKRDSGLMSLQDYLKVSDDMDKAIFKKAISFIQNYFTKKQVFKIVDKKVGERYFEINTNNENKIRIGKFDLEYKTTLKILGREERFSHWSEMIKTIASVNPALISGLLPAMLKDTESPIALEVEELIQNLNEQQAQMQNPTQDLALQLELQEKQAKIEESLAKARKYNAQGILAQEISANNPKSATKEGIDLR